VKIRALCKRHGGGPAAAVIFEFHASAEKGSGAGYDYDLDNGVGGGVGECGNEVCEHGWVQRVSGLGTVEGEGGDVVGWGELEEDGFIYGCQGEVCHCEYI
jgi:hypothetical protein